MARRSPFEREMICPSVVAKLESCRRMMIVDFIDGISAANPNKDSAGTIKNNFFKKKKGLSLKIII